jgi:hypothetical protein
MTTVASGASPNDGHAAGNDAGMSRCLDRTDQLRLGTMRVMSIDHRAARPSHGAKQSLFLVSEIRTEVAQLDTWLALSELDAAKFLIRATMEATREFAECPGNVRSQLTETHGEMR